MKAEGIHTYRHSGKFGVAGILLPLAVSLGVGFPLGSVYAYAAAWIPFVYVNVLFTLGYGYVFAFLATQMLMLGKVRNNGLAALVGFLVGLVAEYLQWNGHAHALIEDAPVFCRPDEIWCAMGLLYEHGSWSVHSIGKVTGLPLAAAWLVEGLLIVGISTWFAYEGIAATPFCEKCQRWLNEVRVLNTLAPFTEEAQITALKSGDLTPLLDAKPRTHRYSRQFARILLKRSPACDTFCTLRLANVTTESDDEGRKREKVTVITRGDLMLPSSMFELLERFASFEQEPAAGKPPPAPPSAGVKRVAGDEGGSHGHGRAAPGGRGPRG